MFKAGASLCANSHFWFHLRPWLALLFGQRGFRGLRGTRHRALPDLCCPPRLPLCLDHAGDVTLNAESGSISECLKAKPAFRGKDALKAAQVRSGMGKQLAEGLSWTHSCGLVCPAVLGAARRGKEQVKCLVCCPCVHCRAGHRDINITLLLGLIL